MLYEISLIFISMLAAIGIVELVLYFFGHSFARRLSGRFCILVEDLSEKEAEATLRMLETIISLSPLDGAVCEVRLGNGIDIPQEVLMRLCAEYRNITVSEKE